MNTGFSILTGRSLFQDSPNRLQHGKRIGIVGDEIRVDAMRSHTQ